MKIVLDTNVLISGLINPNGIPAKIVNLLINGKLTLFYDNRILKEYEDVLYRKKFGFTSEVIEPLLEFIRYESQFVTANPIKEIFIDEDDKMFLEVAETAKVEYLITGNISHFPKRSIIITPKELIEKYS